MTVIDKLEVIRKLIKPCYDANKLIDDIEQEFINLTSKKPEKQTLLIKIRNLFKK